MTTQLPPLEGLVYTCQLNIQCLIITTPHRLDRTMQDIVAKLVPGIVEGKPANFV